MGVKKVIFVTIIWLKNVQKLGVTQRFKLGVTHLDS